MPRRADSPEAVFFLQAVLLEAAAFEVRTARYSTAKLFELLDNHPVAIALAPDDRLSAQRLLESCSRLMSPIRDHSIDQDIWTVFACDAGKERVVFKESLRRAELSISKWVRSIHQDRHEEHFVALMPGRHWAGETSIVQSMLCDAITAEAPRAQICTFDFEGSDRDRLIESRRKLLELAGAYSSEELATAVVSTSSNASQYAADQRKAGKLFGVRFGQAWHYPKFQFDANRRPIREMKDVLAALSPDPYGWDRLQWFLEQHEKLDGKTPFDVWKSDRDRVIAAANTERWHGRD